MVLIHLYIRTSVRECVGIYIHRSKIVDLQLYVELAALAQDVDYFYIVLLLQICMLKDIGPSEKYLNYLH
jgi:hypothetical protein